MSFKVFTGLAACAISLAGCGGGGGMADEPVAEGDAELAQKATDHWFYAGALPKLETPRVTISLAGHTAHVVGFVPAGTALPSLPHVRTRADSGKLRLDVVYPIATARPGKTNATPGDYRLELAKPYRPDGIAVTQEEGEHFVTWGGFPFLAYHGGIALHGPITARDNKGSPDMSVL